MNAMNVDRVDDAIFIKAVRQAAASDEACAAVHGIYASMAGEIERRRPVCDASGKCCRFDSYGHRLYVTTLELGAFVNDLRQAAVAPAFPAASRLQLPLLQARDACAFQRDNLCGVHDIRPFGCRMFYCDPTTTDWQNDAYERYHGQLKRLHKMLGVPYLYVEWRWALEALGLAAWPINSGGSAALKLHDGSS